MNLSIALSLCSALFAPHDVARAVEVEHSKAVIHEIWQNVMMPLVTFAVVEEGSGLSASERQVLAGIRDALFDRVEKIEVHVDGNADAFITGDRPTRRSCATEHREGAPIDIWAEDFVGKSPFDIVSMLVHELGHHQKLNGERITDHDFLDQLGFKVAQWLRSRSEVVRLDGLEVVSLGTGLSFAEKNESDYAGTQDLSLFYVTDGVRYVNLTPAMIRFLHTKDAMEAPGQEAQYPLSLARQVRDLRIVDSRTSRNARGTGSLHLAFRVDRVLSKSKIVTDADRRVLLEQDELEVYVDLENAGTGRAQLTAKDPEVMLASNRLQSYWNSPFRGLKTQQSQVEPGGRWTVEGVIETPPETVPAQGYLKITSDNMKADSKFPHGFGSQNMRFMRIDATHFGFTASYDFAPEASPGKYEVHEIVLRLAGNAEADIYKPEFRPSTVYRAGEAPKRYRIGEVKVLSPGVQRNQTAFFVRPETPFVMELPLEGAGPEASSYLNGMIRVKRYFPEDRSGKDYFEIEEVVRFKIKDGRVQNDHSFPLITLKSDGTQPVLSLDFGVFYGPTLRGVAPSDWTIPKIQIKDVSILTGDHVSMDFSPPEQNWVILRQMTEEDKALLRGAFR